MANMSVSPNQSFQPLNYSPAQMPALTPASQLCTPAPLLYTPAQDNTRVAATPKGQSIAQHAFVDHKEENHAAQASHKPTPGGVIVKHTGAMALEHGVHHVAHKVGQKAAEKAVSHGLTRATEHAAGRAAEHAVGHAAARGAGSVAARAVPAVGAVVAGGLAVMSATHSYEAAKHGEVGAAFAYGGAALIDAGVAVVNVAGAATGVGTVISTPLSIALGVAATGLAAYGAWLESD